MRLETEFQRLQGVAIQASGALVAFRSADDKIALASANCHELLDAGFAEDLLGLHARDVLGSDVFHALRNVASLPSILRRREHIGQHILYGKALDISAFQSGELIVVEIAPADIDPIPEPYDVLKDVLLFQDRVLASNDDSEVFQSIVILLRTISGYDCVAACRYHENKTQIVASAGNAISAEETFEVNAHFHMVPDIERHAVKIRSAFDIDQIDLSLSGLRCPPGPSLQKLRGLGATACATQGIQIGQRLWGYLIFLHRTPRMTNHTAHVWLCHTCSS